MKQLLEFRGITKSFPGVKALENVSFDLNAGEVHVIVGENGAGKSTLMKILSGAYTSDSGEIILEGSPIVKNSPRISEELGIRMIYQELNLVPELSIASNVFLGHELKKGIFVSMKEQVKRSNEMLTDMGIKIDSSTLVKNLGIGTQQMVEIVKALSKNAKIIVFDEPTSSLTESEITELFRIIRLLKERGVGMFYISHRLEEIFQIGDRVTILRDGHHILTDNISNINMSQIIEGIAGRKIKNMYPYSPKKPGGPVLEVKNLCGDRFKNVNMTVRAGEIVGVSGLIGAGRTETVRAVFGIDKYTSGEVLIEGKKVPKRSPEKAAKMGMCLLPEDRKVEGLALPLSIRENTTISSLNYLNPTGIVNERLEKEKVDKVIGDLSIATFTMEKLTRFLSGGTQQKVVIAKWLMSQSKMFIFDEPTRGIDVGAKSSIYELMNILVENGAAILMISSDLLEVLGMSDRIYVMSGGEVVGEVPREEAEQEKILSLAFSNVGRRY
jgi:ABC-type sugar transport system, ATPase component